MTLEESIDIGYLLKPETEFERQCNLVFDSIIFQMKWRFEKLAMGSLDFEFLIGESIANVDELKKSAANLAKKYHKDLDSEEFQSEIESFKFQASSLANNLMQAKSFDRLKLIHKYSLLDAYLNIEIALLFFLTLPVSVASCERRYSKLKLVKTF